MCFSGKQKKVSSVVLNRVTGNPIKFDDQELQQLRKKFLKVSGHSSEINRQMFLKNMGILGLQSAQAFSDRLFNSFDINNDNSISFQDFVEYMQILKCGSQKNKARISFKLIDYKNLNKISIQDFKQFLDDFFRSWSSITNLPITDQIRERTDEYVKIIFNKVYHIRKERQINFKFYADYLYNKDKQFMEVFDFITHGVGNLFIAQNGQNRKGNMQVQLQKSLKILQLINSIEKVYGIVFEQDDSEELFFLKVAQEQFPQSLPKLNPRTQKASFSSKKSANDQNNIQPRSLQLTTQTGTHFHENTVAIRSESTNQILQTSRQKHLQRTDVEDDCCHSSECRQNRRKLEYLEKVMSRMIQQNGDLKNDIKEELDKKQISEQKFKKRVNNVHNSQPVTFDETHQKFRKRKQQMTPERVERQRTGTATIGDIFTRKVTEGNMVFFGDQNWNLVLNMMIGIQMAVRSVRGYTELLYEEPKDFNLRYYFELVPRRFGDDDFQSTIYSFTDYAPNTFNHIRRIFNIDNEQYIRSIGPNRLMASLMLGEVNTMTELTSQGKSGSFFYYTADGKYMLKTIKEKEYRFLRSILRDYYYHLKKHPKTLITKFYGLHKLVEKDDKGKVIRKSYFVIMANIFNTRQKITQRYDIKGSWFGRENPSTHPNTTKKDNDFLAREPLKVPKEDRKEIVKIIRNDAQFFQQHGIIDYSLLIGIAKNVNKEECGMKQMDDHRLSYGKVSSVVEQASSNGGYQNEVQIIRRDTEFVLGEQNQMYLFGIIDTLTEYDSKKVAQYYFKRALYGPGISAVPPPDYAKRFVDFIENKVFPENQENMTKIQHVESNVIGNKSPSTKLKSPLPRRRMSLQEPKRR